MKTLPELLALIDLALAPSFDVSAAEARLGPIEEWYGALAQVTSSDPAVARGVIETRQGAYDGLQVRFAEPLVTRWSEVVAALGEPVGKPEWAVDDWDGPPTYKFVRADPEAPGRVLLKLARTDDTAVIKSVVVRRPKRPR